MGERTSMFGLYPYKSPNENVVFPYYLLGPKDAQKGAKYPLIVVLHGRSGHAYGGWVLADQVVNRGMPTFVLVPMMEDNVKNWMDPTFRWRDFKNPRPIDHVALLTKKMIGELPIDPSRVYITGYSMGGVGTFGALKEFPDIFAAGVPICGGWHPEHAKEFITTPIWAFHGSEDKGPPPEYSRNMVEAIRKAGGTAEYTEYPGVGHNSWIYAYNEPSLWVWLFRQKKIGASSKK